MLPSEQAPRGASRPWKSSSLPRELTRIPSMLSSEELQYLTWLTAECFEGWGAIVDLGPWLGSSSAALAEGLKRRSSRTPVHSFDLFRWEPSYMEAVAHADLRDGEDFLPLFLREIGDYAAWVRPRKLDLSEYTWNEGPIEVLFVDAAKTWALTNAILRGFGQHLVPGKSRVVLQDFRYHDTYWLPLIFDSRPDLWREVEDVEDGHTVTFIPLKPLVGPAGIHPDYSEDAFPLASAAELLRGRMARESEPHRRLMLRAFYKKYLADGSAEEVRALREELVASGVTPGELEAIGNLEPLLVPRGWEAFKAEDFDTSRRLAERCIERQPGRPVYAVALLGMSLIRLGDLEDARRCLEEVVARLPLFLHAKLYRAELAIAEGRYQDAEADALDVLKRGPRDEPTVAYGLGVLAQAWAPEGPQESHMKTLTDLAPTLDKSPAFLAQFARERSGLAARGAAGS